MKVLIAYDGSECAQQALEGLSLAGLPQNAEALVVSVGELWMPPPSAYTMMSASLPSGPLYDVEGTRKSAVEGYEKVRQLFPQWNVNYEILVGSPSTEILHKADSWKPDLILVGSHGRSAVGRILFGSVSQKIVTEARCSVRIGRPSRYINEHPLRILVAVDGSLMSKTVVQSVTDRHWPEKTEVLLVTSVGPFVPVTVGYGAEFFQVQKETEEDQRQQAFNYVQGIHHFLKENLLSAGLKVNFNILVGDPKYSLLEEAEKWPADCIFIGSRGLSGMKRFLLGSVSSAVVARAKCSVEVVRSTAESKTA